MAPIIILPLSMYPLGGGETHTILSCMAFDSVLFRGATRDLIMFVYISSVTVYVPPAGNMLFCLFLVCVRFLAGFVGLALEGVLERRGNF